MFKKNVTEGQTNKLTNGTASGNERVRHNIELDLVFSIFMSFILDAMK